MYKLLAIILFATSVFAQQPNTNWCSNYVYVNSVPQISIGGANGVPGPFVWNIPNQQFTCWLYEIGRPGQIHWTFFSSNPPVLGFMVIPSGIIDIDLNNAFLGIIGTLPGTYVPCPANPWLCGSAGIGYGFIIPASGSISITTQTIMTDPASASGFSLTGALYLVR